MRGCWYGSSRPLADFPVLVDLYRRGELRLDPLITEIALEDVNGAFARMEAGDAARSVIVYR